MQRGVPNTNAPGNSSSPASTAATGTAITSKIHLNGGRFDFDDGGTYCGGWEDGKAHGHGVCTGPKGQGAYSGSWHFGFEVSGTYIWPSGSTYEGQWQNGKRHGLGMETRGRWMYRGEWTQGFKGRYGLRQSTTSNAKYEGTWANGLQDGYGSETYADTGTYQGQWLRGMRHGYGVRTSAPFGLAAHYQPKQSFRVSLSSIRSNDGADAALIASERDRRIDDARGGFVLKAKSDEVPKRRRSFVEKSLKKSILSGLKLRKQRSTGDLEKKGATGGSLRSNNSSTSWMSTESSQLATHAESLHTDSNASFVIEDEHMDANITETYMGEWKNDRRSGFGISERSDGLRYEGEWFNNKKYGYGVTILRDGTTEQGKYKNNMLITSQKKKQMFVIRSAKFKERIDAAVNAAQRASKIALQKADIAISRTATAKTKAEMADLSALKAREDFEIARNTAKQFAPEFVMPSLDRVKFRELSVQKIPDDRPPKVVNNDNPNGSNQDTIEVQQTSTPPLPPRSQTPNSITQQNKSPFVRHNSQIPQMNPMNYHSNVSSNFPPRANFSSSGYNEYPDDKVVAMENSRRPSGYNNENPKPANSSQMEYPKPNNYRLSVDHNHISYNTMSQQEKIDKINQSTEQYNRNLRRNSRLVSGDAAYSFKQAMSDHFDHYKIPPSRDNSVDRYTRAASRLSVGSRQPSIDRSSRPPSEVLSPIEQNRGTSIASSNSYGETIRNRQVRQLPFEDIILRKKSLGQDIVPSPIGQPKRTESLYGGYSIRKEQKNTPIATQIKRKNSLPDFQALPKTSSEMSREESSRLSSAQREQNRRLQEENERLRANPLLYLVSPNVKEWFSRQQLLIMVLFVNISLAIVFFKLLTS